MRIQWNYLKRGLSGAVSCSLLLSTTALCAQNSLPQLWPIFSEPSTLTNIPWSSAGQNGDDYMAVVSLQGAYNQLQGSNRLYLTATGNDTYWQSYALPSSIAVSQLSYTSGDADGILKALLNAYGPSGSNSITGYIVCDPINQPETCNLAMTMAGVKGHTIVIDNTDNETLIGTYYSSLTKVADLTTYLWANLSTSLPGSSYNLVNPGTSSDTDWATHCTSGQTSTHTTFLGDGAIEWTSAANEGNCWIQFTPTLPTSNYPYIFSVQVAGTGSVYLDAYNGANDVTSSTVTLSSSGWTTIQLAVPIPQSGATGNTQIQFEVRTPDNDAVTVYFTNATLVDNRIAVDTYLYNSYMTGTNTCNKSILTQDFAGSWNLRDYQIAAKMCSFDLSSNINPTSGEGPEQGYPCSVGGYETSLYQNILTWASAGTPIMGYIDSEFQDVSCLSNEGHFLNASDDYYNGSVWASIPQPSSLSQPAPSAITANKGTIYLAFEDSDGDNASIIQHQMNNYWTDDQFLGAVPSGWTMPPGMINFSPGIISHYYTSLPGTDEIVTGPGGVGYATYAEGSSLQDIAVDTDKFMQADSMNTATSWQVESSSVPSFVSDSNGNGYTMPHVVWHNPDGTQGYTAGSSDGTWVDGQPVSYNGLVTSEISAIESAAASAYSSTAPGFVEALNDDLTTSQDDLLYIAQYLQNNSGYNFVFMTPSELAATWDAYSNGTTGLPTTAAQAVPGTTLLSGFPQNMVYNNNGQDPGQPTTSTSWALGTSGHDESLVSTIYNGGGAQKLQVPGNSSNPKVYAYEYLGDVPATGRYYKFTANVAGSGTAFMCVYDGSENNISSPITLTSSWQTITMIIEMKSTSTGQIQVGLEPSSSHQTLYFTTGTGMSQGWYYTAPTTTSGVGYDGFGGTTYNNGYFNQQALFFSVPANQSGSQWMNFYPTGLIAGDTYTATVDVAGTGQAYVNIWNGSSNTPSSTITLGSQWQTITTSATIASSGTPVLEIEVPTSSSNQTAYFRNARLIRNGSGGTVDFNTGFESGQTQLSWTNTVDTTSPGGGESNVTSAILEGATTITHGGGNSVEYGGTAGGGSTTHAYMEAISNSTTLASTSRLSYWIYPMTPMGSESGASTMTGLNSTCAAVDIIFTDGTALRNYTTITDQFGNRLHPAYQCDHLQPDQWNYVTVNLGSLSGLTVSRIDIGYDQPGATGNYGGYVDDITLSH